MKGRNHLGDSNQNIRILKWIIKSRMGMRGLDSSGLGQDPEELLQLSQ
jgi:hypothetical protein